MPDLMSFADVLDRLQGVIGRTELLQHLANVPTFAGQPMAAVVAVMCSRPSSIIALLGAYHALQDHPQQRSPAHIATHATTRQADGRRYGCTNQYIDA